MAEARFLQITFVFRGTPKIKELEPVFNSGTLDWLRVTSNVWIIWTTNSPTYWYEKLKPYLGPEDSMYIFGIDNTVRHGWASKWIWDWLDKKR